jgi:hypothetical protein
MYIIAKKLKKTWVDIKKVKSKWKAEKHKEGLVGCSNSIEQRRQQSGDIREEGSFENSDEDEADEGQDDEQVAIPSKQSPNQTHMHTSRTEPARKENSLRDMMREAYSPSSLHTYKSDPLGQSRGRGGVSQRGRGSRATNSSADERDRGRGQPNMKLRMGAILEKIKRDYS